MCKYFVFLGEVVCAAGAGLLQVWEGSFSHPRAAGGSMGRGVWTFPLAGGGGDQRIVYKSLKRTT